MTALTREIMTIQAEGDYAKAKALGERLGVVRPPVQRALDALAAVPVDIEPKFTTAEQLARRRRVNSATVAQDGLPTVEFESLRVSRSFSARLS